jgi:hypothetical protein
MNAPQTHADERRNAGLTNARPQAHASRRVGPVFESLLTLAITAWSAYIVVAYVVAPAVGLA